MASAFCAALVSTAIVFAVMGTDERGTVVALRVTARLSFLLFWAAYAGGAMAALFGPPFDIMARHGRDFGLGFAAAHAVHVALIIWFFRVSAQQLIPDAGFLFEAAGLVWIYVLAAFSIKRLRNAISLNLWRYIQFFGLEYIALVFVYNFVVIPILHGVRRPIEYLPFAILILGGTLLRLIAAARYMRGRRRATLS